MNISVMYTNTSVSTYRYCCDVSVALYVCFAFEYTTTILAELTNASYLHFNVFHGRHNYIT